MFLLKQSIVSAFRALRVERFRTALSLLGVCVGIFAVVSVLTVFDSIRNVIFDSIESFGSDVVMIEQIPLEPDLNEDGFFKWWEYISRPQVSYKEYQILQNEGANEIDKICFCRYLPENVNVGGKTYSDGEIVGVSGEWNLLLRGNIGYGRDFLPMELSDGDAVTVIGHAVAQELFGSPSDALGKYVWFGNERAAVVGVFEEVGSNEMSMTDMDKAAVIPYSFSKILNVLQERNSIGAMPSSNLSKDDFLNFLTLKMRSVRGLEAADEDNFALNTMSFLEDEINEIFSLVNIVGWLVGCFSLLIGGFGIANIMFVAVNERIPQIGIMKALGARRRVIVTDFLVEAVMISLVGAMAGIVLAGLGVTVINAFSSGGFALSLSFKNLFIAVAVSFVIGIAAGVAPAVKAASLQPSVAISSL